MSSVHLHRARRTRTRAPRAPSCRCQRQHRDHGKGRAAALYLTQSRQDAEPLSRRDPRSVATVLHGRAEPLVMRRWAGTRLGFSVNVTMCLEVLIKAIEDDDGVLSEK